MDPQISIEAEFKDGKLHTGLERAVRGEERVDEGWRKITRSASQAEREIERFAKRTNEINSSPVERYLAASVKLHDALQRKLISQEVYNKSLAKAKAEYEALEDAAHGAKEAEEGRAAAAAEGARREQFAARLRANSVKMEFEENLKAVRAAKEAREKADQEVTTRAQFMARVRANSVKMEYDDNLRRLQEAKAAQQQLRQAQQESLGGGFLGQVMQLTGGYLSLQAAVNLVAEAFRHAKEESREALASLRGLDDSRRRLNQIATSPEELESMIQRADSAAATFGVDRKVAYDTLFQARNYGIQDQFESLMAANQLVAPDVGTRAAGKMATMFPGTSPMAALNMTVRAARTSELDVEQFASVLAIAGEGGRMVKANPAESMAALGVLSSPFATGKTGADRLRTFMIKTGLDKRFTGQGLLGTLDTMQAMSEEERSEFLKTDMEINAAYASLTEFEAQIRKEAAEIAVAGAATGTPDSELSRGIGRATKSSKMQAAQLDQQGKMQLEIDRESALATTEAGRSSVMSRLRAAGHRSGLGTMGQFGMHMLGGLGSMFGLDPASTGSLGMLGADLGAALPSTKNPMIAGAQMRVEFFTRLFFSQEKQLEVLKSIDSKLDQRPGPSINQVRAAAGQRGQ